MYAAKKFVLRFRKDDETWKEISLVGEDFFIGSSEQATLQLADGGIFPLHVHLELKPSGVWITDLDSISGTILEGKHLTPKTPVQLKAGQSFQIGDYFFTFLDLAEAPGREQAERVPLSSIEKLTAQNRWLRWVLEHAALVSGITLAIAVIAVSLALFISQQQSTQTAMDNQTATSLASEAQFVGTPTPGIVPSEAPISTATFPSFATRTVQPIPSASQLTVVPPGLGNIQINPINVLSNGQVIGDLWQALLTIGSGQSIDLATTITGSNIGFVYRYTGLKTTRSDGSEVFETIELQYLGAETNQEIGGVLVPDWGEGEIPIKFNWKPVITQVGDGERWENALIYPVDYGSISNPEGATYATNGRYTYLNGNQVPSRVFFDGNGKMIAIFGYKENEGFRGTPFEIVPEPGEKFTVLLQQFEFKDGQQQPTPPVLPSGLTDLLGQATTLPFGQLIGQAGIPGYGQGNFVLYEGGMLSYQGVPFSWKQEGKIPGDYVVGILVEDLSGSYLIAYVPVRVVQ